MAPISPVCLPDGILSCLKMLPFLDLFQTLATSRSYGAKQTIFGILYSQWVRKRNPLKKQNKNRTMTNDCMFQSHLIGNFASIGNDGWVLSMLHPWAPDLEFVRKGWLSMRDSPTWTADSVNSFTVDDVGYYIKVMQKDSFLILFYCCCQLFIMLYPTFILSYMNLLGFFCMFHGM
jgi:hypothetical protein